MSVAVDTRTGLGLRTRRLQVVVLPRVQEIEKGAYRATSTPDSRKERETMRARVDRDICIGSAMCVATAPEVFELGDDGLARAVNPDPGDDDLLRDAAQGCPVQAITLEDAEGNQVYP